MLSLQKKKQDKLKYASDIKKEILRFKHALKMDLSKPRQDSAAAQTESEKKEQRRKRKDELERRRREAREALPLLF